MNNTTDKQAELAIRLYDLQIAFLDGSIQNVQRLIEERKDMIENKLHYTSEFALQDESILQKNIKWLERLLGIDNEEI